MYIRDHVFFKDCEDKIYDLCLERFKEECIGMGQEEVEKAEKRLFQELDIVINNGFSCDFYLRTLVAEFAKSRHRLVVAKGLSAYSYVAYLLGISDINPILAGFPLEMAFSFWHDRCPHMPFSIPNGFDEEIAAFMENLFGCELVRRERDYIALDYSTEEKEDFYIPSLAVFFSVEDMISKADEIIASKGGRDSLIIFLKERDTIVHNKDILQAITRDGKYQDIMHATAVYHGSGIWPLKYENSRSVIFFTCDDVYRYGLKLFNGRSDLAYELMDKARKGRGGTENIQSLLEEYGAEEEVKEQLREIDFLISEGACVSEVQIMDYVDNHTDPLLELEKEEADMKKQSQFTENVVNEELNHASKK